MSSMPAPNQPPIATVVSVELRMRAQARQEAGSRASLVRVWSIYLSLIFAPIGKLMTSVQ